MSEKEIKNISLPSTLEQHEAVHSLIEKDINDGQAGLLPDKTEVPAYLQDVITDRLLSQDDKSILLAMARQVEDRELKGRDMVYVVNGAYDVTWRAIKFYMQRRGGYELELVSADVIDDTRTKEYQMTFKVTDNVTGNTGYGSASVPMNKDHWAALCCSFAQRNAMKTVIPEMAMVGFIRICIQMERITALEDKISTLQITIDEHKDRDAIYQRIQDTYGKPLEKLSLNQVEEVEQTLHRLNKLDKLKQTIDDHPFCDELYEHIQLKYDKPFQELTTSQVSEVSRHLRNDKTVKEMVTSVRTHHRLEKYNQFKAKLDERNISTEHVYQALASRVNLPMNDVKKYTLEQIFTMSNDETINWLINFEWNL